MNILFIQNSLAPFRGGIARVSWTLADFLCRNGHECYFAFYNVDTDEISAERKLKYPEDIPYDKFKSLIMAFIKQNKIDVIINQDQNEPKYIQLYREIKDIYIVKIIDCMHNLPDLYKYWPCSWKLAVKLKLFRLKHGYDLYAQEFHDLYQVVDRFVLLSNSFIPVAKKCYGIKDDSKLSAISDPLPFERNTITPFIGKKNQFLIISRLDDHQKNLRSALRIWQLFEKYQTGYELVLAGYGSDERMLLDYAKGLGLKYFRFIGKTTDPIPLYEESKYFMLTSRYEGFGMTLVEAQQCGCIPFAFGTYSALHDIIVSGKDGFIIPNGKEMEYADAMYHAVTHETEMKKISEQCFYSSHKFAIDNIGKEWLQLLNN